MTRVFGLSLALTFTAQIAFASAPAPGAAPAADASASGHACSTCSCGGTGGACKCGGSMPCKVPGALHACPGDAGGKHCCGMAAAAEPESVVEARMKAGLVVSNLDSLGTMLAGAGSCGHDAKLPTGVAPGPRGLYVGEILGGGTMALPRYVDPKVDGTKFAKDIPAYYADMVKNHAANSIPPDEFDAMVYKTIPPEVFKMADDTIAQAKIEYAKGLAAKPPEDEKAWRRFLLLSWAHSRDMTTVTTALGHPMNETGHHHVNELIRGQYIRDGVLDEHGNAKPNVSANPWYLDWVKTLKPDQYYNIAFFSPNLGASSYNWGFDPEGLQDAMNAHRLSNAHNGNPELPTDWYLRASSFVAHHVREHMLVREEARGDWSYAPTRFSIDPAIKDYGLEKMIATDVVALDQLLEAEGKITPWQLLAVPPGMVKNFVPPPEANRMADGTICDM